MAGTNHTLDLRYRIAPVFCGHREPRFVALFCGQELGRFEDEAEAISEAQGHRAAFLEAIGQTAVA